MSVKKTEGKTYVTSYRIGIEDKKAIAKKHGTLANFLNKCVAKELGKKLVKTSEVKKSKPKKKLKLNVKQKAAKKK